MSTIKFRPRGGQQGIAVTKHELVLTARRFGQKYIDTIIPLPRVTQDEQKKRMETCKCDETLEHDTVYWETDEGSHGWCCSNCGKVNQWG